MTLSWWLQCCPTGWLPRFPANLLFRVSTLVLNGVPPIALPPWKPNSTSSACALDGLTDWEGWPGMDIYSNTFLNPYSQSGHWVPLRCRPFTILKTEGGGLHGNAYYLLLQVALVLRSLISFLTWTLFLREEDSALFEQEFLFQMAPNLRYFMTCWTWLLINKTSLQENTKRSEFPECICHLTLQMFLCGIIIVIASVSRFWCNRILYCPIYTKNWKY